MSELLSLFSIVACLVHTAMSMDQACLDRHNMYRSKHRVSPLTWDNGIEQFANYRANECAKQGQIQHKPETAQKSYGENLYLSPTPDGNCVKAVDMWYDENKKYNYQNGDFSAATGHFTALIWKSTTTVGCGTVKKDNKVYVACNYKPPGNVGGKFQENVVPPKGQGK